MQDIVPRKSIRDIEKPKNGVSGVPTYSPLNREPLRTQISIVENDSSTNQKYTHQEYAHIQKNNHGPSRGWQYIFGCIIIGSLVAGMYLHIQKKVTVFIVPHTAKVSLNNDILDIPTKDIVLIKEKKEVTVPLVSTGTKKVESKAQGMVTLFNTGSQSQLLVSTTRLQTPNGNIYRLDGRVTVPAAKGIVPGSIEAKVIADGLGNSYNVTTGDFTLPGLVGTPRFKQVYARTSKGIQGGASELVPQFEQSIVDRAILDATTLAKKDLEVTINTRIPNASRALTSIVWSVDKTLTATSANLSILGQVTILDDAILATRIANEKQLLNLGQGAVFANTKKGALDQFESGTKNARIRINGEVQLEAFVSNAEIQKMLAGKSFNQFASNMKSIVGSKSSRFTSKPFWIQSFPHASRIEVIVE